MRKCTGFSATSKAHRLDSNKHPLAVKKTPVSNLSSGLAQKLMRACASQYVAVLGFAEDLFVSFCPASSAWSIKAHDTRNVSDK